MALYFVKKEHTLGILIDQSPYLDVLRSNPNKGASSWANFGQVHFTINDIRPATPNDFDEFRVAMPHGFTQASQPEFDAYLATLSETMRMAICFEKKEDAMLLNKVDESSYDDSPSCDM